MKIYLKFFIPLLFLVACKEKNEPATAENIPLYPEPITVAVNTNKGYSINPITGDSIVPLVNSFGDTVKTGIPIPFNAVLANTREINSTANRKIVAPTEMIIQNNVHPLPSKLTIIPVDTTQLKKVKMGKGVIINVTAKKMPFREPHPVKALPMRFKDAATANIQYLDVEQGMSSSYVYSMLEDKKGNLWFTADGGGISKYDGVSFSHYGQKEGLSEISIYTVMEDSKSNIWIGTQRGVDKFDGKNFTQYNDASNGHMVNSIIEDNKGNIWFGTNGGLTRYDGKEFTNYTTKDGLPNDTVLVYMEDRNGNIWIGSHLGVAKLQGEYFTYYSENDGLLNQSVTSLLEDSGGNIWIGTTKGLIKFNGKSFICYSEKEGLYVNSNVSSLMEDKNGNIWISTIFGGLNKFDGKKFTYFNQAEGLSNNKVRKAIEDHNGNIWFGTDGGGINKLNDAGLYYLSHNEVLDTNRVRPIIKDRKGNIWFGTESDGIGKYDAATLISSSASFINYILKDVPPFNGHRSLLEDKKGNIWIGTIDGGIYKYDGNFFLDYSEKENKTENTIFSILEDKSGNIWFARNNSGISKFDGTSFSNYTEKEGLPAKRIFSLYEDKNGTLWFGTDGGGLSKYDGAQLINYTEREGLFGKSITSIIDDGNGNLWLGTLGAGVCKFDGKHFTYYTEREGLSNNNVWSLIKDSTGNIWAGTDKGLNRFDNRNGATIIYNYGLQDGLKAVDFNLHSACIDNNNRIWWGTGKNIVIKDLNKPFETSNPYPPKLSYMEINNQFYDFHNFPDSLHKKISFSDVAPFSNYPNNLKLAHDQNHISFHFSAIDWSASDKIKYSYRMAGLDEKWSTPSEETMADYRNLSHGNYQLQVKATGQSQVWTEPFTYNFTILPAWWQTWWFRAMVVLAVLTLVFFIGRFIYFYQLRKQRVAMEKQLAVQYERQRISAEMHDDIGAGLSGIRLLTEMTKSKVKDEQTAEEVNKIYQSVGDISSKMKEVIWSLNTENDNLPNLIAYLQKQARLSLENYPCHLAVELPEKIASVEIDGETRRNIVLIVKEAIHNIIKHSGSDKVNLTINSKRSQLTITIADNGRGIVDTQIDAAGNGMKNMRKRIEKLKGKLSIQNKEGLTLIFEIPIKEMS